MLRHGAKVPGQGRGTKERFAVIPLTPRLAPPTRPRAQRVWLHQTQGAGFDPVADWLVEDRLLLRASADWSGGRLSIGSVGVRQTQQFNSDWLEKIQRLLLIG